MSDYGELSGLAIDGGEEVSKRVSPFLVPNLDGGGYARKTKIWDQFRRFLVLGSDRDAYYATARKLTGINVASVLACLDEDPVRFIDTLVEMRTGGIVPNYDTVHFALALAFAKGNSLVKAYARSRATELLRTASNLESWLAALTGTVQGGARRNYMRGWGRSVRGMATTCGKGGFTLNRYLRIQLDGVHHEVHLDGALGAFAPRGHLLPRRSSFKQVQQHCVLEQAAERGP